VEPGARGATALGHGALDVHGRHREAGDRVLGTFEASELRCLGGREAELGREEPVDREALSRLAEVREVEVEPVVVLALQPALLAH